MSSIEPVMRKRLAKCLQMDDKSYPSILISWLCNWVRIISKYSAATGYCNHVCPDYCNLSNKNIYPLIYLIQILSFHQELKMASLINLQFFPIQGRLWKRVGLAQTSSISISLSLQITVISYNNFSWPQADTPKNNHVDLKTWHNLTWKDRRNHGSMWYFGHFYTWEI